ncbi:MAG: hypothetical protein LBH11_07645 [Propionibacteriaceae bacterium]|jgi:hypothetical protein|nr:hypothetical protein [Propionibacteriaceae bacterium]
MGITDKLKDIAEGVGDKIGEGIDYVKRESAEGGKIDAFMDKVGEKLSDAKDFAVEKVGDIKEKLDGDGEKISAKGDKCCCGEKSAEAEGDKCCDDKSEETGDKCCGDKSEAEGDKCCGDKPEKAGDSCCAEPAE